MKTVLDDIKECVSWVIGGKHKQAVIFSTNSKYRVKATYQGKPNLRSRGETFLITLGKPNWAERAFLAVCKKAGSKPKRPWLPNG